MDELLDIVTEDDRVTGAEMRSTVHQRGLLHRGVHVFLFTADGRMLVQKRSADRATCPSLLDCSVSEHVQAGESHLDAALRGMREELNISGVEVQPLIKFRMQYGINDNEISILYKGQVEPAQVKFDPVEIESIQYLRPDELRKMIRIETSTFCGWFVEIFRAQDNESTQSLQLLEKY